MKITKATREYEAWLRKQLKIVKADLAQKHRNMSSDPFIFLRATFYRWIQIWPEVCSELTDAPEVLAVGDLHIENFGTWRDVEGRLIWGVNDFDEVFPLPYTQDLVRLATSANLAIAASHLSIDFREACEAILRGYRQGLTTGGKPFVLEEEHPELRKMAYGVLRQPARFWEKMDAQKRPHGKVPASAVAAIRQLMPEPAVPFQLSSRQAGEGSLGRQRFVGLATWQGGRIAREAKALCPSACVFALRGGKGRNDILYQVLVDRAVRCRDPFVHVQGQWIVRRLAPHCSRIELSALPQERDERVLLESMGFELANIHLGTPRAVKAILADLDKRSKSWLFRAARRMTRVTRKDWKVWRDRMLSAEQ